jgi:hypothetical protein
MNPETTKPEPSGIDPNLKADLLRKLDAESKEWDAQLALWSAKLERASANLRADFHQWQQEFQGKRGAATKTLESIKDSGHTAWEEMKTSAEKALADVKTAFESAKKKFN